ncbi:hypothetical protein [Moorella naiadis (nom. illeg.)]|uniref:hypothetical protein n=1 Tax=Moorella naiadis (nom. illeg.) TaxID=3093670 RepID=UPI003D9CB78B
MSIIKQWCIEGKYYTQASVLTQYGNWWEWEIGVPLRLNDIAFMAGMLTALAGISGEGWD